MHTWKLLLWYMYIANKVILSSSHLAGKLNIMPDALFSSRILPTELTLHPTVTQMIFQRLDRPHIDLFASAMNNRLPVYCSCGYDPKAWVSGVRCPVRQLDRHVDI